jgi:BioD-like phosphotransacetylase family protein
MKSLYVTSIERYSGKTAVCLALARRFRADGYTVGYFKPLSLQPWRVGNHLADEDAAFVKEVLNLEAEPWELSPVVVTPQNLREYLEKRNKAPLMQVVQEAYAHLGAGHSGATEWDLLLLEGGGSLREGYGVGLATPDVARTFGSIVLAIVKYRGEIRVLDDALTANRRLGDLLGGILINRVPEQGAEFVKDVAVPYFEEHGMPVLGVLPEVQGLEALTVAELVNLLEAEVLTEYYDPDALVETLTVGAMTADAALSRFRKQTNKAVITGGDRSDIQLAALETSTVCLILTGNLHPSPLIIKQADEFQIPILLVRSNTMETVETIEGIFGKTRLGQIAKLQQFEALMSENVNFPRLYEALGMGK